MRTWKMCLLAGLLTACLCFLSGCNASKKTFDNQNFTLEPPSKMSIEINLVCVDNMTKDQKYELKELLGEDIHQNCYWVDESGGHITGVMKDSFMEDIEDGALSHPSEAGNPEKPEPIPE